MDVVWIVLQALAAFCVFFLIVVGMLALVFAHGQELTGRSLRALLNAKPGKIERGEIPECLKAPPDWLRIPQWLAHALERENMCAGSRFALTGRQLATWAMLRFGSYVIVAILFFILVSLIGPLMFNSAAAWKAGISIAIIAILLGVYSQWGFLAKLRKSARGRLYTIRQQLPYAIDMFVLVLDAGGNFNAALEAFAAFGPEGPTREEIILMLQESRTGATRDEMLDRFAKRNPLSEIDRLALVVRQGEKMGTSLLETFRGQAELLRAERLQRATATAERMAIDGRLWLAGVALAVMLLLVGPFVLAMVPGLKGIFQ